MQKTEINQLLRQLPSIEHLLEGMRGDALLDAAPRGVVRQCAREVVATLRARVLVAESVPDPDELQDEVVIGQIRNAVTAALAPNLQRTVNATGVVIHTNLGRSLLAEEALENLDRVGRHYSNLEFDLRRGRRGSRYTSVEGVLCELTGAEAAMVVNNNAGAVFLCLETLARDREVVVSRGELVEIGGSFRIPDVMARSGARLHEVGTTNRTHLADYQRALGEQTGLLLKVHTSNYSIVGFTAAVTSRELADLGQSRQVPVMEDLGSGTLIDFSTLGLDREPTVQETVAAGVDVITFSGDKLLGGPQAGIILGRRELLDRVKKNPLTRALRIDKLTLAALESTLRLYRDPRQAMERIPTLRMLTLPPAEIEMRARHLSGLIEGLGSSRMKVEILDRNSRAGGGSMPLLKLPSSCVALRVSGISANELEGRLRGGCPPIIGRIEDDLFLMDVRTLQENEPERIRDAIAWMLQEN